MPARVYPLFCARCVRFNLDLNSTCKHTSRTRYIILDESLGQKDPESFHRAIEHIKNILRRDVVEYNEKHNRRNIFEIWAETITRRGNAPYACWRHMRTPGELLSVSRGDRRGSKLALEWEEGGRKKLTYVGFIMWKRVFELALECMMEIRLRLLEMRPANLQRLVQRLQRVEERLLRLGFTLPVYRNSEDCEDNREEMDNDNVEMEDRAEDDMGEMNSRDRDWEMMDNYPERWSDFSDNAAEIGHHLSYNTSSDDGIPMDNPTINEGAEQKDSPDDPADVSEPDSGIKEDVEQDGLDDQTAVEDDSSNDAILVSEKMVQSPNPTSESPFSQSQS